MGFCRLLVIRFERRSRTEGRSFGVGARVAQLVERVLGKDEVISSILIMGSSPNENATDQEPETFI